MTYNVNTANYRTVSYNYPTQQVTIRRSAGYEQPKSLWDHFKEEAKGFGSFLWERKGYVLAGAVAGAAILLIAAAAQSQPSAHDSVAERRVKQVTHRPQEDQKYLKANELNALPSDKQRKIATASHLKKMPPEERQQINPAVIKNMQDRSVNALRPSVIKSLPKDSQQEVKIRAHQQRNDASEVLNRTEKRLAKVESAIRPSRAS